MKLLHNLKYKLLIFKNKLQKNFSFDKIASYAKS